MRKIIISLLLTVVCAALFGQNFSGEITRDIRIIPKAEGLDADSILALEPGERTTYLITDGFYKSSYLRNGEITYSYTYRKGEYKMYDYDAEQDYITWRDSRIANDTIYQDVIYKDSIKVVKGYECFLVKTDRGDYVSYNYYAKDLRVKYDNFQGHAVGNWYNNLVALDGAQLLLGIEEHKTYTKIVETVKLDKRRVKKKEFNLPDKPVYASYQALDELVNMNPPSQEVIQCYGSIIQSYSKKLPRGNEYTVYLSLVVKEDGTVDYVKPVEKDKWGLYEGALSIINTCNLPLIPGKKDGAPIASETYFPVKFQN